MVGFPDESEREFETSLKFVRDFGFIKCHVFPYSKRPGTRAAALAGQLPREVKDRRAIEMKRIADESRDRIFRSLVGSRAKVIIENGRRDGYFAGYTERYVPVDLPRASHSVGELAEITITGAAGGRCLAK